MQVFSVQIVSVYMHQPASDEISCKGVRERVYGITSEAPGGIVPYKARLRSPIHVWVSWALQRHTIRSKTWSTARNSLSQLVRETDSC